jgi:hypothetical protein
MPSAEDAVIEQLFPSLIETHGVSIQYAREGVNAGTAFSVIRGRSQTQLVGANYTETSISDDFIALKSDLVSRSVSEPARGDRILWTDTVGVAHVHEVLMPGSERQWDKVDQFGRLVRIHTKEI